MNISQSEAISEQFPLTSPCLQSGFLPYMEANNAALVASDLERIVQEYLGRHVTEMLPFLNVPRVVVRVSLGQAGYCVAGVHVAAYGLIDVKTLAVERPELADVLHPGWELMIVPPVGQGDDTAPILAVVAEGAIPNSITKVVQAVQEAYASLISAATTKVERTLDSFTPIRGGYESERFI